MAFRWWTDDSGILILPPLIKLKKKRCQSWTPSDKIFWIRARRNNLFVHKEINGLLLQTIASLHVVYILPDPEKIYIKRSLSDCHTLWRCHLLMDKGNGRRTDRKKCKKMFIRCSSGDESRLGVAMRVFSERVRSA